MNYASIAKYTHNHRFENQVLSFKAKVNNFSQTPPHFEVFQVRLMPFPKLIRNFTNVLKIIKYPG
jgi:hypothetical protein